MRPRGGMWIDTFVEDALGIVDGKCVSPKDARRYASALHALGYDSPASLALLLDKADVLVRACGRSGARCASGVRACGACVRQNRAVDKPGHLVVMRQAITRILDF